jgi:hypothetical protein
MCVVTQCVNKLSRSSKQRGTVKVAATGSHTAEPAWGSDSSLVTTLTCFCVGDIFTLNALQQTCHGPLLSSPHFSFGEPIMCTPQRKADSRMVTRFST